jgi:hypothetical protein
MSQPVLPVKAVVTVTLFSFPDSEPGGLVTVEGQLPTEVALIRALDAVRSRLARQFGNGTRRAGSRPVKSNTKKPHRLGFFI